MSSTVEQIKAKLDIAEVIGSYIKLEKAGLNFRACCPFHNEKTPSFFVSPARQTYHCFGCNRGGDMFSFVQEIEGVDFMGALESLARRAGVEIKSYDRIAQSENERLYKVLAIATDFYATKLTQHSQAKEYLEERGLKGETINNFRLGFAPAGWRHLYDYLRSKGFGEADMDKAGLVVKSERSSASGRYYDRFRSRIMFPLFDPNGRVVGFSGRIFGDDSDNMGKYINSPQTSLYDKSRFLYGYDRAKLPIRQSGTCVLVEGQLDLILSHQVGVENAVAVSGTALTDKHLGLIKRLADKVVMAFDADSAGFVAARRAFDLALATELDVLVAELPSGLDPADLIKQEKDDWKKTISEAKHMIDVHLSFLTKKHQADDSRILKLAVSKEIIPSLAKINNALDQAHFVSKIAARLGMAEEPIWEEVRKAQSQIGSTVTASYSSSVESEGETNREDNISRRLYGLLAWQRTQAKPVLDLAVAKQRLVELLPEEDIKSWEEKMKDQSDRLILEMEILYAGSEDLLPEFTELLTHWRLEQLNRERQQVLLKIKQAERENRSDDTIVLLGQCQKLTNEINNLKTNLI